MSHELPHPRDVTRSVTRSLLTGAARRATCAALLLLSGTAAAQSPPVDAEPDAAPVPAPTSPPRPPWHAAHGHHGALAGFAVSPPGLGRRLSLTPLPVDFGNLYAENLGWGIAYTAVELSLVAPMMWFVGGHMDHGRDDTRDWSEGERNGTIALVSGYVVVNFAAGIHAGYSAAATYRADMLGQGMTSVATCQNVHDQYDANVRPAAMRMGAMSGDLDAFMGQHGGGDRADVGCATADMLSELDRHHALTCQLADLPADQAEAVRHVGVMTSLATHLNDRSDQMMAALGGAEGGYGPMMNGCEDWDGAAMMHRGR